MVEAWPQQGPIQDRHGGRWRPTAADRWLSRADRLTPAGGGISWLRSGEAADLQAACRVTDAEQLAIARHLTQALARRDPDSHGHIGRSAEISAALAQSLGWSPDETELLRQAAPLHDIGKLGIPDRILLKPGPLTAVERAEIETHTTIGYGILAGSELPLLDLAATIALAHHERVDGCGYPNRLAGDEIPLAARIVAVADVFDALTNDRVYRPAFSVPEALEIMRAGRGTQFDAEVLDALLDRIEGGRRNGARRSRAVSPGGAETRALTEPGGAR